MTPPAKNNLRRHQARCCAAQALYQWQHTHDIADEIIRQFTEDQRLKQVDIRYFSELVHGAILEQADIDALLSIHLDRSITQLNPVELAILRIATYELKHYLHVPYRVVINEALEIAKAFGAEQGHKYVNAVLHKLVPTLRVAEPQKVQAKTPPSSPSPTSE